MNKWVRSILVAVATAVLSSGVLAQDAQPEGPLVATLLVERVEFDAESKKESLAPAATAFPGDLLQYTGTYENISETPLPGLVVNGAIPNDTVFSPEGLNASQDTVFEVLIEGEPWQGVPAYKTVKHEDGTEERVEAVPADYKQIRWRVVEPLESEAALVTVYRVRVNG